MPFNASLHLLRRSREDVQVVAEDADGDGRRSHR